MSSSVINPADWPVELFSALVIVVAGLLSTAILALFRHLRHLDQRRMNQLNAVEHRQWHVIRWIHNVGRKLGEPFPLEDDIDDHDKWDEGLK